MMIALTWLMPALIGLLAVAAAAETSQPWEAQVTNQWVSTPTARHMFNEYPKIFPHGNRNAASHRWATFILQRSEQLTADQFEMLFRSFCPISGSPVSPSDHNRYRLALQKVGGGTCTGHLYFCCSPCICDAQDLLRVDTKTVTLSGGHRKQYTFTVIGNPCKHPTKLTEPWRSPFSGSQTTLAQAAPDVNCAGGVLDHAWRSDNGYIIIGMLHGQESADPQPPIKAWTYDAHYQMECAKRAAGGFKSGMGLIFREVAQISPIGRRRLATKVSSSDTDDQARLGPYTQVFAVAVVGAVVGVLLLAVARRRYAKPPARPADGAAQLTHGV